MKTFSRWMPPAVEEAASIRAKVVFAAVVACLALLLVYSPKARGVSILILVFGGLIYIRQRRSAKRLRSARPLDDIGTFARALDRRSPEFDPWVVRAVWDGVQSYCTVAGRTPIRPSDRLDSYVDPEDWINPLAVDAAKRSGRTTQGLEANPVFGGLVTIEDMIRLLSTQQPATRPDKPLQPTARR
jgi:hypothetical protein